jgi:hypothetical protein
VNRASDHDGTLDSASRPNALAVKSWGEMLSITCCRVVIRGS